MAKDLIEIMSKLTPREKQICEVIKREPSLTVNGLAHQLNQMTVDKRDAITPYGAKFHLHNVYRKFGVNTRAELVANLSTRGGDKHG